MLQSRARLFANSNAAFLLFVNKLETIIIQLTAGIQNQTWGIGLVEVSHLSDMQFCVMVHVLVAVCPSFVAKLLDFTSSLLTPILLFQPWL